MRRKLQALLCVALLAFGLPACGGDAGSPQSSSSSHWLSCGTDADCSNLPVAATCGGEGYCVDTSGAKVGLEVTLDANFSGSALDPAVFGYETGFAVRNGDLEFYTDRADNAYLDQGELVLVARAEQYDMAAYTSASIETKGKRSFTYGRIEAEVLAPTGAGVGASFWMLPEKPGAPERTCDGATCGDGVWPVWGDVVIASLRSNSSTGLLTGINYATQADTGELQQVHAIVNGKSEPTADGYHRYRLDWGPERMDWFVDDVQIHTVDLGDPAIYHPAGKNPFHRAFHLKLSLSVGGLAAAPTPDEFPQEMRVRSLRVSQYQ